MAQQPQKVTQEQLVQELNNTKVSEYMQNKTIRNLGTKIANVHTQLAIKESEVEMYQEQIQELEKQIQELQEGQPEPEAPKKPAKKKSSSKKA